MASNEESTPAMITCRDKCPVVQVIVYKDKAQVSRKLETVLKKGTQQIIVVGFSYKTEAGSLKVAGSGQAAITDVKYVSQEHFTEDDDYNNNYKKTKKEMKQEICAIKAEIATLKLNEKKEFIDTERYLMEKYFETSATSGLIPEGDNKADSLIQGVEKCMIEYRRLKYALLDDEVRLTKIEEEMEKKKQEAEQRLFDFKRKTPEYGEFKECVITLDAPEEAPIELTISYMVPDASWVPAYDVRVSTEDSSLKLVLNGMVCQDTDEKWEEAKMFLTTAEPVTGGYVSDMPEARLVLSDKKPKRDDRGWSMIYGKSSHNRRRRDSDLRTDPRPEIIDLVTSASYEVPNPVTIPNDNNFHKVTMATVDMTPELYYLTAPKTSPKALLLVKCPNTSPYVFLAGVASLYLDGDFMNTVPLPTVFNNEDFLCCLGADSKVVVNYKPLHKTKKALSEEKKTVRDVCEQSIEVKNLHDKDIKVFVRHRLPESDAEEIKVTLVSNADGSDAFKMVPHAQSGNKSDREDCEDVMVLEWALDIAGGESGEAVMKYALKYPAKDTVKEKTPKEDEYYY